VPKKSWRPRASKVELSLKPYLEPAGYKHTGNGGFYIRSRGRARNPDYVDRANKRVLEVFGTYWHRDMPLPDGQKHETPEEMIAWYKYAGWDCIIIWEDEVAEFMKCARQNHRVFI
jgi:G:T-mismatch repair DNA endonuclease (very short patch repair protein)